MPDPEPEDLRKVPVKNFVKLAPTNVPNHAAFSDDGLQQVECAGRIEPDPYKSLSFVRECIGRLPDSVYCIEQIRQAL
jgi:hypothetical protein